MIIDSHCHLVSHKYLEGEMDSIITRALDAGVGKQITLATNLEDCPQHLAVAEKYPSVFACIGIHPCDVHSTPDNYMDVLEDLAKHDKCVGIGETGLDYFHASPEGWTEEDYHARQRALLREHFELAKRLGKNIVIHTRDRAGKQSMDDALTIYRDYAESVRAVFHCFLGPLENAEEIFKLGGLISFTGIATFKSARDCSQAAANAPVGTFMLETDAPYLAPTPHRGKRCEPAYTLHTAEHIATLRGETLEELTAHTSHTAEHFYGFSSER